ncbi:hypothetical protein [Brevifollis gellanilyticus]|uniref:PBP domain-containing protein n=1 Tax=Brevifollis gellanilyticus TaxID=748831 RepID=A0A512MC57_9BACT|nr:hypothetical protein [Brevifollis gellanilyticus]GEP44324.1 hypothetical protein BGE01nite_36150 [Brevifollis gellanilyticus]
MKSLKTLALSALVLSGASLASAQTVVRIVASNGDRTATQTAISNLLDAGWKFQGISGNATSANLSVATGANFGAWNGTYAGGQIIIKVSFSGALAGIAAVAGNLDQRFVSTDGTGTGTVPNPLTSTNQSDYEVAKADFGFSTNFQSTSPFSGTFQGVTYSTVTEEIVGVSPLGFYASPGYPGSPVNPHGAGYESGTYKPNITTQLAYLLYNTGSVSLAQLTGDYTVGVGDPTDHRLHRVYAIGRNTDAGQRFGAYTEVGLGTTTNVTVWFPTVSGATTASGITYGGTVTSHQLWPVNQQPGTFAVPLGGGGYNSGANLAAALTVALTEPAYKGNYLDENNQPQQLFPTAQGGYYIGYLTPGDANNRVLGQSNVVPAASRGVSLRYNGVELTDANVRNGTYTAWLYNRILKPQTGLTGTKLTFANALRDRIRDFDAPSGGGLFNDASFLVRRFTDGGIVTPKPASLVPAP